MMLAMSYSSRLQRLHLLRSIVVYVASVMAFALPAMARPQAIESNAQHLGGMMHPLEGRPTFEVASLRLSRPGAEYRFNGIGMPPGHFEATGTTVRDLILFAYAVPDERELTGGPGWIRTDRYDLLAKPAPTELRGLDALPWSARQDQYRMRLQTLLEERFKLQARVVQSQLPLLVIEVAKGGFKCKQTDADHDSSWAHLPPPPPPPAVHRQHGTADEPERDEVHYKAPGLPFSLILGWISQQPEMAGRTLVDRTGLRGGYACEVNFSRDPTNPAASSLFTALREQMGLRVRAERGPVETLKIESIERPSTN